MFDGLFRYCSLVMARRAVARRVVVFVAVNTLSHLELLNLCHLCHGGDIAVTGGADAGRAGCHSAGGIGDTVGVGGQVTNVRFVDEVDMVRKPVNSFPVDWMRIVTDYSCRHANLR